MICKTSSPVRLSRFAVGLIGNNDVGMIDEGTGDSHALPLASGELGRLVPGKSRQPDSIEEPLNGRRSPRGRHAGEDHGKLDVLPHGKDGYEVERLEDKADPMEPDLGQLCVGKGTHVRASEQERSVRRIVNAAHHVQEGRFPAP